MKKLYFLSLMLLTGACLNAQNIKELDVKTSYLEYPKIPVENIDFDNLVVEFAHSEVKMGAKSVAKSANLCKAKGASIKDAKALETFYYRIKYTSPEGVIKISNANGDMIYAKISETKGEGVDEFGKNECYFMEAILESAYKKMHAKNDSILKNEVYDAMYNRAQDFVNKSISFYYKPEEIEVHYVKTNKEFDYSELQMAANTAVEGYQLLNNNYNNQQGKDKLKEAIAVWEKTLAELDANNRKAKINKRVGGRLYKNIALAYAYLLDYDAAMDNIQSALKLYPSTSNNSTVIWEQLNSRFYKQKKSFDMNKDAEVVINSGEVKVINRGIGAYAAFKSDYKVFSGEEMKNQIADIKKTHAEGVASGKINPYEEKMVHSATQGYMLVLPSLTGMMTTLAEMKEAMKKLEEFPVEVCELTQLNQLTLKNNHIKTIPTDIKNLVNLKRLDMSKNQLAVLPVELGELKELNTLILKGNPLNDGELDKIQKLLPDCKIKF
ncbi:leucine-rich repeat domain-containing protein [Labilibacter sediminis]|nr:leucine-rich repeat domain-containing protein [Labilibacter sediminis]